jgi:hypothetical protein
MSSRVLAGLLVAGCLTAAGGGAYVAVHQNAAASAAVAPTPDAPVAGEPAARPVAETEAVVGDPQPRQAQPVATPAAAPSVPTVVASPARPEAQRAATTAAPARRESAPPPPSRRKDVPAAAAAQPAPAPASAERPASVPAAAPQQPEPVVTEVPRAPEPPPPPPVPQFEEVVLPTSSVIGLQVDTSLSSERARVEDRVEARVTRDVMADGRLAIPAGARVLGAVTTVERGGKVKERARLGVRFHTLVLADGREVPLRTETIYREGDSPANESARKIGGAAVGGAILGAILGGGKGAATGATIGAAGGTAAVMAGDRNAATLPPGTVVTVRLSAPATLEVEKRQQ